MKQVHKSLPGVVSSSVVNVELLLRGLSLEKRDHDLHLHTQETGDALSSLRPRQLVEYADDVGLKVIGVTDRNTLEGAKRTLQVRPRNVIVAPGMEVYCSNGDYGFDAITFVPEKNIKSLEQEGVVQELESMVALSGEKCISGLAVEGITFDEDQLRAIRSLRYNRGWFIASLIHADSGKMTTFSDYCSHVGLSGINPASSEGDVRRALRKVGLSPEPFLTPERFLRAVTSCDGVALIAHPGRQKDFNIGSGDDSRLMTFTEKKETLIHLFSIGFKGLQLIPRQSRMGRARNDPARLRENELKLTQEAEWAKAARDVSGKVGFEPIIVLGSDARTTTKFMLKPKQEKT